MLFEAPTLIIPPIEDRAMIGKYTTENGPFMATRDFRVSETTAKRAKTRRNRILFFSGKSA